MAVPPSPVPFTLGMVGPAVPREFAEHLGGFRARHELPAGLGGSPVNLLTRELLRRGHRVTLFTLDPLLRAERVFEGPQLKVVVGPYRPRARTRALDMFRSEREFLLQAIRRERPDVLHAQWTYEFAWPAQQSRLPLVVTAHDAPLNVLRFNPTVYRLVRTLMAYRVLAQARNVVAVAPHVGDHLRRFMLYQGPRQIIPNGMPQELFDRPAVAGEPRRSTAFATVLVGWGAYKNGRAAIEAFARVRARRNDATLHMFGPDHGPGQAAQRYADARGIGEGITFVGALSHATLLARLASEVDVLIHPSLEEAQPMVLIEAMALGIPVIAGRRSGGVPWTLDDGRAGLLVDVRNPESIAEGMRALLDDPPRRAALGLAGRALARKRFHIASIAAAYEPIYERLHREAQA